MRATQGDQRRKQLLTLVRGEGHIVVSNMAAQLDVAVETVRRDLKLLEDRGLLRRTHGGAYPVHWASDRLEQSASDSLTGMCRIAMATAPHFDGVATVFLDKGAIHQLIARQLVWTPRPLAVVTASLINATILATAPYVQVILLGGRVDPTELDTVDHWTTTMLTHFAPDLAILGANGLSVEGGATVATSAAAALNKTAMYVSKKTIFVGDHLQFGVSETYRFATADEFDVIITDQSLPVEDAQRFAAKGLALSRV